jgi:hypothetical protein
LLHVELGIDREGARPLVQIERRAERGLRHEIAGGSPKFLEQ